MCQNVLKPLIKVDRYDLVEKFPQLWILVQMGENCLGQSVPLLVDNDKFGMTSGRMGNVVVGQNFVKTLMLMADL